MYATLRLYQLFSNLVEYPTPFLMDRVNECISLLTPLQREAADLLWGFKTFLTLTPLNRMEELHSSTFDLNTILLSLCGLPSVWRQEPSWNFPSWIKRTLSSISFLCR